MDDSQIAAAFSRELSERIGEQRFTLWFSPPTHISADAGGLTIRATSPFVRDWLRQKFGDDVRDCWESVAGGRRPVTFDMDVTLAHPAPVSRTCTDIAPCTEREPSAHSHDGLDKLPRPSKGRGQSAQELAALESVQPNGSRATASLASFVVGPSNEYAFRAAELTARGRQQASPVLLCGPTGVGKTHLLRAIGREFRRHYPRAVAVYLSAEQFTTGFIEAIRGSGLPSFRQKCRGAQLLVVDDIQFFTGKQRTLEELQYTVDALLADGRQLLFGSDRTLGELQSLGSELMSRLAGGLICEIEPPEFATRLGIARKVSQELGLEISDDVLKAIATQITAGARELRGALHRIEAMSHAYDQQITRELADKALADLARHSTRAIRLADVEQAVCGVFGVEPAQLRSDRKVRSVSDPRMLAMWLARKYTRAAWSEIGHFFGRRSHSTVIAAHRRVERMISSQAEIGLNDRSCGVEEAIRRLEQALRSA
jgi:chromosomal replication initiator protein